MRTLVLLFLTLVATIPIHAADSCFAIYGRARMSCGDGQLRIWHIGTHHEYAPDESSRATVEKWLHDGFKDSEKDHYACPASMVYLYADFLICPTEPFKKGSVQQAKVESASHRHYVKAR